MTPIITIQHASSVRQETRWRNIYPDPRETARRRGVNERLT